MGVEIVGNSRCTPRIVPVTAAVLAAVAPKVRSVVRILPATGTELVTVDANNRSSRATTPVKATIVITDKLAPVSLI